VRVSFRITPLAITFIFVALLSVGRGAPAGTIALTLTGAISSRDPSSADREFIVPEGIAEIDVDCACADDQSNPPVDLGIRGPAGIRGWSPSGNDHVHIDRISASYGYLPGPIEPGRWHVMLGAVEPSDPHATYTVTIKLSNGLDAPRQVLRSGPGWFAGDLHVHSGHSDGYQDGEGHHAPVLVRDLVALAEKAHLDFLAVTDHNTASHWIDVDRTQAAAPDLLLLHGREVTTARGHFNAVGERRFTDYRLNFGLPMPSLLSDVGSDGSFLSINHPWLKSDAWCAGCGWADRDPKTIGSVAGVEVVNGSTPTSDGESPGWIWWADALNAGARLVAVGGSDVHDPRGGGARLGYPSTVVWASDLSEPAIVAGLKAGRVFLRSRVDPRAIVDLSATNGSVLVHMGEHIAPGVLTLSAHITGADGQECRWIRRGAIIGSTHIPSDDAVVTLPVEAAPHDWFSVVVRDGGAWRLISNAIYVDLRP